MTVPDPGLPYLPKNTMVPSPKDQTVIFLQYFNRLYEDIAYNVNKRDFIYFPITITHIASNVPGLANFGSFIVCISGTTSGMPAASWALCKADQGASGLGLTPLTTQAGTTGVWSGATLTMTSTATNYQINHSVANTTGNFNIRIIGTQ